MSLHIEPFEVRVSAAEIADLRDRLGRTRWTDALGAPWEYGVDKTYLMELCRYWAEDFDWRNHEARFNAFPQFTTEIDGQRIHFYHVRSSEPDAKPLIITHGWPGSVAEFHQVIGPLTNPGAYGGDPRDAFHIVAPSLPGYGYSGPQQTPGWRGRRVAAAFDRLMGALGYERYFAQGGDKGSLVTILLGALYADRVAAIQLNILSAPPPDPANPKAGLDAEEASYLESNARFAAEGSAYQQVHRTRPQTLAFALMDSPAGLAAWIVDKFQAWADCNGAIENAITRDRLLDNISLYWLTGTIGSSMRFYFEDNGPGRSEPLPPVRVPTGIALFPGEIFKTPRSWAERRFNITRWSKPPRGGHFAALEQPDLFVEEVRAFFRDHR
jgi:microsomal epoxide hydrolase